MSIAKSHFCHYNVVLEPIPIIKIRIILGFIYKSQWSVKNIFNLLLISLLEQKYITFGNRILMEEFYQTVKNENK